MTGVVQQLVAVTDGRPAALLADALDQFVVSALLETHPHTYLAAAPPVRADTVATKPSFRAAFRQRRCLVPADGFYEWKETQPGKPKQPYLIARADRHPFSFAGLWEQWKQGGETIETFSLITTDANATVGKIHHRMPVIIAEADRAAWLDPANKDAEALLKPAPDDALTAIAISTRVNNVRNDGPELIEPVDPAAIAAAPASPAKPAAKPRAKAPSSQGSLF